MMAMGDDGGGNDDDRHSNKWALSCSPGHFDAIRLLTASLGSGLGLV